jgi:hypothetical protein
LHGEGERGAAARRWEAEAVHRDRDAAGGCHGPHLGDPVGDRAAGGTRGAWRGGEEFEPGDCECGSLGATGAVGADALDGERGAREPEQPDGEERHGDEAFRDRESAATTTMTWRASVHGGLVMSDAGNV